MTGKDYTKKPSRLGMIYLVIWLVLFVIFLIVGFGLWAAGFSAALILLVIPNNSAEIKLNRRDADAQSEPFTYQIGRHANETLALRYGVANIHDGIELKTIQLKKISKLKTDFYEVELVDFGDRKVIAVIENGTDYVKTFYPKHEAWFKENEKLEELLKGNSSLSIIDIAKYHIDNELRH